MPVENSKRYRGRTVSLAIVSGKGGSGKTLIATALAQALGRNGHPTLLVDADIGTGGLSYYLGFRIFAKTRQGLTEFVSSPGADLKKASPRKEFLGDHSELNMIRLVPVGEHRALIREPRPLKPASLADLIDKIKYDYEVVIFDCRGGIDADSLAVCQAVDDVLVVAETDAASIQSTQYLSDVLAENGLSAKIAGFILNKVMDDPSSLAQAGSSFFRTEYLGAVPFDIETTRGFIKGALPDRRSIFARHVEAFAAKLFPELVEAADHRIFSAQEYGYTSLVSRDSLLGSLAFAVVGLYAGAGLLIAYTTSSLTLDRASIAAVGAAGISIYLLSLSDRIKQAVGQASRSYMNVIRRVVDILLPN